jgi:hypothetical protein
MVQSRLLRFTQRKHSTVNASWPFADPPNLAVITLKQIIEQGHPIRYVSHDQDDGGWQFLTGDDVKVEDARVVALHTMLAHDPTLAALADLPLGSYAWRMATTEPWQRGQR